MELYIISNIITGDTYVGKTQSGFENRFRRHIYAANAGSNTYLHRAIRKYGEENFSTKLLESQVPATLCSVAERNWIEFLKPTYNLTDGGEGGDTSRSPNYISGMKNRIHPHTPSYGMLGKKHRDISKLKGRYAKQKPCCVKGEWYFSITQACEVLGIGRTTFQRWIKKGYILFA